MNLTALELSLLDFIRTTPEGECGDAYGASLDEVAYVLDISEESARDLIASACSKKALRCEHTNVDGSIAAKAVGWSASPVFYVAITNA